jgi:hypothetical protein
MAPWCCQEFYLEDILALTDFQGLAGGGSGGPTSTESELFVCELCGKAIDSEGEFGLHVATCFGEADDSAPVVLLEEDVQSMFEASDDQVVTAADSVSLAVAEVRLSKEAADTMVQQYSTGFDDDDTDLLLIEELIKHVHNNYGHGAILVFLPSWYDISQLRDNLNFAGYSDTSRFWVLPLHSGIPAREQQQVFKKPPR